MTPNWLFSRLRYTTVFSPTLLIVKNLLVQSALVSGCYTPMLPLEVSLGQGLKNSAYILQQSSIFT